MNKNDYDQLIKLSQNFLDVINIERLIIKKDRTLLFGYNNNIFRHVYIKDNEIITVEYKCAEKPTKLNIQYNKDYYKNMVFYPECCDKEFCLLLLKYEEDFTLDFKYFKLFERRKEQQYYGDILK